MLRRLLKLARAALFSFLLLLVLLEAGGRFVFPLPEVHGFHRLRYAGSLDDFLEQDAPNLGHMATWWWSDPDGAAFPRDFNTYGFHDREWGRDAPAGSRRVAFVGDSFVEGLGAPTGASMTDVFASEAAASGEVLDVLNWGAGGFGLENYAQLIADGVPAFAPDDLVLVLYANDLYTIPQRDPFVPSRPPPRPSPFQSRIYYVVSSGLDGLRVPSRWREQPSEDPRPIHVEPRFAADPQMVRNIDEYVEPEIAESMRAGRLNPAMTNLLFRSVKVLPQPIELEPYLAALRVYLEPHQTRVAVAFLPSMNQVSDAYLTAQRRISAPVDETSLMKPEYQQHARDIARACAELGVPFLDLSDGLRAAEDSGQRHYWPYDGHMTPAGYAHVGAELYRWWQTQLAPR
jgi:hypothetical protein